MIKFCPYCGNELKCVIKFCTGCGAPLPEEFSQSNMATQYDHSGTKCQGIAPEKGEYRHEEKPYKKPVIFKPYMEQNEQAFAMLIPYDWHVEGGIYRPNPLAPGAGIAQSIQEPFLNMAIMKDRTRKVLLHYLPCNRFYDLRDPFFPPGSTCNGMTVLPSMRAADFLTAVIIPQLHPYAVNLQVIDCKSSPSLIRKWQEHTAQNAQYMQYNYDSIIMTLTYEEEGITYKEKIMTATIYYSMYNSSMWENQDTKYIRTPSGEFDRWEPVFSMIESSVRVNMDWLIASNRGVRERSMRARETQQYIQNTYREIIEHKHKVQSEINKEYYLSFTNQDEYVNPYTGDIETDTNLWKNRWVGEGGYILYTDDSFYDPNTDANLNLGYFKPSSIRAR